MLKLCHRRRNNYNCRYTSLGGPLTIAMLLQTKFQKYARLLYCFDSCDIDYIIIFLKSANDRAPTYNLFKSLEKLLVHFNQHWHFEPIIFPNNL